MQETTALTQFIKSREKMPAKILLTLVLRCSSKDWYPEYMLGVRSLIAACPEGISYPDIPFFVVPEIYNTYTLGELSKIFRVPFHVMYYLTLEINYGPSVAAVVLQQSLNSTCLSPQVSTVQTAKPSAEH